MDKLKNLLKSDTPTDESTATSGSGTRGLTGQGSHFASYDEKPAATGSTVTGTEAQTKGPEDVSAAPASSTAAALTGGPEQGGTGHVNTVSASEARSTTSHGNTGGAQEYNISSADFPKTQTSADGSGSAAIGQTSTYSSSHLTHGDPTSSIIDTSSSDPLTYKKPESGSHPAESGVSAGAASTAASLAFNHGEERKREDMSGNVNPYRAESLDPRVDGLSGSTAQRAATTATSGAGLTSATGTPAHSSTEHSSSTAAAPSNLTSTADPADRSAEYGSSTHEKGLGSSGTDTATLQQTESGDQRQSMVGRMLGAVGLGGVLGGAAASSHDSSAVADTPDQPTTTTGLSSYTAPTQQGAPTSHHRKESIPTTAYPSGTFDSVRAINQPVGGAGSPVVHGDRETGTTGAGGATAGLGAVGAAAVGAHEYEQSKDLREGISGEPHGSAPLHREAGDTSALTGVDQSRYGDSQNLRQNITGAGVDASAGPTTAGISTVHHATTVDEGTATSGASAGTYTGTGAIPGEPHTSGLTTGGTTALPTRTAGYDTERTTGPTATEPLTQTEEKDHTARDTAVGAGAGAAAVGAGAYGAHEYSKREAEKAEEEAAEQRKAAEKAAAKEEKHHQKELEKEQKHHQKEVEKAEKKHQHQMEKEEKEAEVAALKERRAQEKEEARVQKQREEEEEDRRNKAEKERLAGAVGLGGAAGAGAAAVDEKEREKPQEKEKKPNIFKRIFKRRKNKDTGADEEYESDEQEATENQGAAHHYGDQVVGIGHGGTYDDKSDFQKPSYNPFSKDETTATTGVAAGTTAAAVAHHESTAPTTLESTGVHSQQPAEAVTGLPASTTEHSQHTAPTTLGSTGTATHQPTEAVTGTTAGTLGSTGAGAGSLDHEAITGLPYDASKDPEAAARLGSHSHGLAGAEGGAERSTSLVPDFTMGEVGDARR